VVGVAVGLIALAKQGVLPSIQEVLVVLVMVLLALLEQ